MAEALASKYIASSKILGMVKDAIEICHANPSPPDAVFNLTDLSIELHCKDQTFLSHCFDRIAATQQKTNKAQKAITVHFVRPGDNAMPPPPLWQGEFHSARYLEQLLQNTPYRASYFHDLGLWHFFDIERGVGLQWMQSTGAYPPWEPAAPLRIFMHWALATPHGRLVHGGTLGLDRKAVLFAGRGGAGKSSTVVCGIKNGLSSAGDDYVYMKVDGDRILANPVFSTLKQDKSGLERLGLGQIATNGRANWQNKFEFSAQDTGGSPLTGPLHIKAILVSVIADQAQSEICGISKNQAMLALAPSALFQMPGERESGVGFFANLVRNLPCYKVILGRNPDEIIGCIIDFLRRI
jgi:hypothetical protein